MAKGNQKAADRLRCALPRLAACFLLINLLLLLAAQNDLLNEACYVASLPLALAAAVLFFRAQLFAAATKKTRWTAVAFTLLFLAVLPLQSLLSAPLFSAARPHALSVYFQTGFLAAVILGAYVSIHAFLAAAVQDAPASLQPPRRTKCGFYPEILPLAAFTIAVVLSALPSMRIGDAPTMVRFAAKGIWDEWHTAGYLIFVRLFYAIAQSDTPVMLAQAVLWLYANHRALSCLDSLGCSRNACRCYICIMLLSFVPTFYVNELIKDTVFCSSLFLFGLEALCFVRAETLRPRNWIGLGLAGFLVSIFRLGGVLPVAITITVLFLYEIRKKGRARCAVYAAAIAAAGFLAVTVFFRTRPDARRNPYYLTYSIPMQMIGALVSEGLAIDGEDAAVLTEIMPLERFGECYMPYHSDALSREYGAIGENVKAISEKRLGPALIRVNWHLFTQYPKQYLTAFFGQSSLLWEITTPQDGYTRLALWYPDNYNSSEAPEGCRYTGFAAPVNRYAEALTAQPALAPLLWRGGFATFLIALSASALVIKRRRQDLVLLLPIVAVTFFLFFSLPAQESRYIIPNLTFAAFAAVYAVSIKNEALKGIPS